MVKKTKKKIVPFNFEKERRNDRNTVIVVAIIIAVVATLVFAFHGLDSITTNSGQAAVIDGIQCSKTKYDNFHINAHLDVFVDGKSYDVPAKIGIINDTCLYWMNTQDDTGVIHIEAPSNNQFTLGQLFDIWKATGSDLLPEGIQTIYINGQQITSSLNSTVIKSHDEITAVYGIRPSIIPTSYQFPPGL
ncbi:MAG: hypothetical protein ACREBI_09070 [Nitrosotalea sp.]